MGTRVISLETNMKSHTEALTKHDGLLRRADGLITHLQERLVVAENVIQKPVKHIETKLTAYELVLREIKRSAPAT